jgi:RNA polymerase sigma factor (sigma-70 family)
VAVAPSIGRADRVEGAPAPEADLTRALYEQYANQIFRYCLHQLGSREEAEDAVQSTFLNAFRGIKRGVVPELESAWLFKIAHNVCLSRRRTSWRRGRIESPTDFDVVQELAPAPSRRADELIGLQDVLEQMPDNQRRAILLREWQGLSYREIAEELELTQAAVETLIFRARRALAAGLEQPPQPKRRIVRGADIGNLLAGLKSLLLGGGAAVKVAATVAVVSAGTVVAAAPIQQHRAPMHAPASPVSSAPPAATGSAPGGPVVSPVVSVAGPSAAFPAKTAAHRRARSGLQFLAVRAFGQVTGTTTSDTVVVQTPTETTAPPAGPGPAETPAAPAVPSSQAAATPAADTHGESQHAAAVVPTPAASDKTSAETSKADTSSGHGSSSGGSNSSQQGAAVDIKGNGDTKITSGSTSNSDSKSSAGTKGKSDSKGSDGEQRKSSSVATTSAGPPAVTSSQTTTESSTTQSTTSQSTTTQSEATLPPSSQKDSSQSGSSQSGSSQRGDSKGEDAKHGDSIARAVAMAVAAVLTPPAPSAVQTTTVQTAPTPTGKGTDRSKSGDGNQGGDH